MPGTETEDCNHVPVDLNTDDVIPSLVQKLPFKIRTDDFKLSIIQTGRPTPKLNIVKRDKMRNCNRTFQDSWYYTHKWLCGSAALNKLFCWPCLLMRPETSSWCSTGTDDIRRLSTMTSKHALCKAHIKSLAEYDATLVSFGMMPEFPDEATCKKEVPINFSESEDEGTNPSSGLKNSEQPKITSTNLNEVGAFTSTFKPAANLGDHKQGKNSTPKKNAVSFKTWQGLSNISFSMKQGNRLHKLKRKIAKQELKNAELQGKKILLELELVNAKLVYYQCLNKEQSVQPTDDLKTEKVLMQTVDNVTSENS